jgi:hypothetical protein
MAYRINDVVRLVADLPDEGLARGAVGVVVAEFREPTLAYEIEFSNEAGETVAQVALLPGQITKQT